MYESGANSEEAVNYNLLFCHACLSFNRTLSSVGDYIDIYLKICDNSRMNLTSQINVCWECMALLKKVRAFKRKVENAQKILDYCVKKQAPLVYNLSDLTLSSTVTTSDYRSISDENADENEYIEKPDKFFDDYSLDKVEMYSSYNFDKSDAKAEDVCKDELMFKIEDVRGMCDILDVKSTKLIPCEVKVEPSEPSAEEERRHRRWKKAVLLVYKRLCGHRYARHFMRPVSDELAPLYSRIVRRPTDLSTIKRRIKDGVIRTTAEFTRALLLMFSNALMYNSSYHEIYPMALEFREETLRELSLLSAVETETTTPPPPRLPPPPRPRAPAATHPPPARPARRRATTWEKEQEVMSPSAPTSRRRSPWSPARAATDAPPAPPAAHAPPAPPAPPARLARRRATIWEKEQDVIKPLTPLTRRRSLWSAQPEPAAAPPRRRHERDWPGLDDEYLVANCFKKYKSTVLL